MGLIHPVTLTALLWPPVAYLLCQRFDLLDAINLSMFEAAAFSFGGLLLWLRSRYLGTTYLNERQARKTTFLRGVRRDVVPQSRGGGGALSSSPSHEKGKEEEEQPAPRTVARLAPVLPAFMACCFFLLSSCCVMSAVVHTIWYVRSEYPVP
ncbi:hypothetical protein ABB37_01967 [Leptomonas pyrrhocoris]|uniref:Uncharacterized protein n=1 Tax=Leptomonas pyrrhocoris TaxID=157538 RepID=A0A0M9G753_LEPPY|nr:hypothetical protein ABB37_01967 [Leptomonas pyrrhocoris]KPA83719.1 hypothetical protein ABB37_01967 [Leptomonas pyrrhocoris]|eukprot:XP_015662158.1 hypothetical protein ABB37_01967 [Leptomonas pyrrhocoris]